MEILYLLVPVGLVVLFIAIKFLFWAINSGQYDDLDTEGQRILFDDDNVERQSRKQVSGKQSSPPNRNKEKKD